MKKLLFYVIILGLLSGLNSCSTYHYALLSSTDRGYNVSRNDFGDFIQENDTVLVSYNFFGENAPVHISIYNKTKEPVYVDWTRSSIIIDGVANSYYESTIPIEGTTELYNNSITSTSWGTFSGGVTLPHGTNVIPPLSRIENTPLTLENLGFDKIPKSEFIKTKFTTPDAQTVTLREKEYSPNDSPLHLRSHLTIYTEDENGLLRKPIIFERSFYINKVIKASNISPKILLGGNQGPGDLFFTRKNSGKYWAIGAATAAGIVITIGALYYEPSIDTY